LQSTEFIELTPKFGFLIDLKYATTDNFVGENIYGPFNRAFLHQLAFKKLTQAAHQLHNQHPDYRFLIYDALRPRSIQRVLWSHVVGTDKEMYVANPDKGSLHNFGMAVDLTVVNANGEPLDMGAGFDDFRLTSQPAKEAEFLNLGELKPKHIRNREILRQPLLNAGFFGIPHEWWHFNAMTGAEARSQFTLVE